MLQNLMLVGLGFLTATLFALIAMQLTWRSAVKKTTRRLTQDLNLDELKQSAERAAMLGVNLQDKQQEISALIAKNAQLEDALQNVHDNAQQLNDEIAELQVQHVAAQAEAETHLLSVTHLQSRVDELEANARQEVAKRGLVETQLRTLGEKATRLLADMSLVAAEIDTTQNLLAANVPEPVAAPSSVPASVPVAVAPVTLTPFRDDDDVLLSDDMPDFAEIKASLAAFGEAGPAHPDDEPVSATEGYIADRIRALKDGVNASA
ncbi:MAG: hypothetical protein Q7T44_05190 [Parvibaculum sp.]|nr:hypothetical protein [Parvibaculum sp.]